MKRGIGSKGKYINKQGQEVNYQSSYERELMKLLDSKGVAWVRNTERFPYQRDGETHHYIPDFYLPEFDLYIETKGFVRADDPIKFEAFPHRLVLLLCEDLKALGCNVKDPAEYANSDPNKWPMTILRRNASWQQRGELSPQLAERVSPKELIEQLNKNNLQGQL